MTTTVEVVFGLPIRQITVAIYVGGQVLETTHSRSCEEREVVMRYLKGEPGPAGVTGTAAPTTGTWVRGNAVWNTEPSAGGFVGWVCVTSGTPGTWKAFGAISV